MVQDMLNQGVIQSSWTSPIILVAKHDSTTRFCVDYCKLKAVTKMDVSPIPRTIYIYTLTLPYNIESKIWVLANENGPRIN